MEINVLRKKAVNEEIDYLFLRDVLKDYKSPRDKITSLLKKKILLRIKKGLYIFGKDYAIHPYYKETLANLLYGPSAISLEYALNFYGFIPERVEIITSITNKRDKIFHTPIGSFSYKYLNLDKYSVGITQVFMDATHPILIASPEKALCDVLLLTKGLRINTIDELEKFLFSNLRLDESVFFKFKKIKLKEIAQVYQHKHIDLLFNYYQEKKNA
jgi:predicted transcriptional regulator of viral defense system